jgi:hypothetical protein
MGRLIQIENSGVILLKAVDSFIGGSRRIAELIREKLGKHEASLENIIENLIFLPLIQDKVDKASLDKLAGYLNDLELTKALNLDISRIISSCMQESRCVKVVLSDGTSFYLDGQLYSIWSSAQVPYDFAAPLVTIRSYIDRCFLDNQTLVIFNAPGYDVPSQEFFSLLSGFESKTNRINNLIFYGNKFEELAFIPSGLAKKAFLAFGVWPWQFTGCRKVKSIGAFSEYRLKAQKKDIYIADIEMDIMLSSKVTQFSFSGCALKMNPDEKTRLVILSNYPKGAKPKEELAEVYLNHWPNLEEAFQDYSRKIELFTYTANSQRFFTADTLGINLDSALKISDLFKSYLLALDAYLRWHLLPSGFEDKDISFLKEKFYNLSTLSDEGGQSCLVKFILPQGFSLGKEFNYALKRINEKEAYLSNGVRLYLGIA